MITTGAALLVVPSLTDTRKRGCTTSNKCFTVHDTIKNNEEALQACRDDSQELAYFMNHDEYLAFIEARDDAGLSDVPLWINGYRKIGVPNGAYSFEYHLENGTTIDFSPEIYSNWHPGEPNNSNSNEECITIKYSNNMWNDVPCTKTRGYVCVGPAPSIAGVAGGEP